MTIKVFIDGQEGTTGLQLQQRLALRDDIQLLFIEAELRKDNKARAELINSADVVFLCLPDDAAKEAVSLCHNEHTIIIDASTAHRTNDDWAYGLPELSSAHRAAIAGAKRIANPGCYATGAIVLLYPLINAGILPVDYPLSLHATSGYSGAGRKAIEQYENSNRDPLLTYPRLYGLTLQHKHLPEIAKISGLAHQPLFNPLICDFYAGMEVALPLYLCGLNKEVSKDDIYALLQEHYAKEHFIRVAPLPSDGFIPAGINTGTNYLNIYVAGNDSQITLVSVLDNLGKGASGAAVQNMNIALGLPEQTSFGQ